MCYLKEKLHAKEGQWICQLALDHIFREVLMGKVQNTLRVQLLFRWAGSLLWGARRTSGTWDWDWRGINHPCLIMDGPRGGTHEPFFMKRKSCSSPFHGICGWPGNHWRFVWLKRWVNWEVGLRISSAWLPAVDLIQAHDLTGGTCDGEEVAN